MSKTEKRQHVDRLYEIGYGKPPVQGQFQSGRSGNPKGRPKKETQAKSPGKARLDVDTRDLFLQFATRQVSGRGGAGEVKMTAEEAVLHSLLSAAVKGSSHAQKNFLDRLDRYRADIRAEIAEDHESWHKYVEAVEAMLKAGRELPDDWPHPDDLVFKEGQHVKIRGGAGGAEAKKNRDYVVGLRDAYMLQSIKDERSVDGPLKDKPLYLSHVVALLSNMVLPKRMQLDETRYLLRHLKNGALRTSELKRRLREAWAALGHPEWADVLTPALRPDALERLRRAESALAKRA